jgi:hypothetical protein
LRLPQLTDAQRQTLTTDAFKANAEAKGLTIYNTTAECVQYWNGEYWIDAAGNACKYVRLPVTPSCIATTYPSPAVIGAQHKVDVSVPAGVRTDDKITFLTYNLGANPDLTPKQQMAYAGDPDDVTVYGGLFQWGRKDFAHSHRCTKTTENENVLFTTTLYTVPDFDANDVLTSPDHGKFIWGTNVNSTNYYDWIAYESGTHYDATYKMYPARWGNGGDLATQANTTYTGVQNSANPCPTGFRVPTQDDWAVLMMSPTDNSSTTTTGDSFSPFTTSNIFFTGSRNSNIIWVCVKNDLTATLASWSTSDRCGWAIYNASVWNTYAAANEISTITTGHNLVTATIDPLLYLPAAGYRDLHQW